MDNTGPYVSVAKLLSELVNAGKATSKSLVLSAKTPTTLPEHTFTFAPASPAPVVGDFIVQGNNYTTISNVSGTTVTVIDGTNIVNGKAKAVTYSGEESDLQEFILMAMAFIDRHTRQWFNARTFDSTKPLKLEGNNSHVMFFPVPILTLTAARKQAGGENLNPIEIQVFNSRTVPDDRKNPMIKLRQEDDDVLFVSSGKWMRGVRAEFEGTFGYLEEDGSTPKLIQRATLKLALMYAVKTLGESANQSATSGEVGPIKREKTDLHEIEYYDARTSSGGAKGGLNEGTGLSGDDEVDDIIAAYKGPMIIGGTLPDIGVEAPVIWSWTKDNNR